MDSFIALLIPALMAAVLIRLLVLPLRLVTKVALHSGCGLLCLGLLNSVSGFTGISFPVNAVTTLIAGFLGLPGIALMALLEMVSVG